MPMKKLENGSALVSFVNVNIAGNISISLNEFYLKVPEAERSTSRAVNRGK